MFTITLKQVSILLGYILLGYTLRRANVITKDASKILSKLLIYVFSPAYTIPRLINGIDASNILKYLAIFAAGIAVCLICILLSKLISSVFSSDTFERNLYKYMLAFSNLGYFGYPLISGVYSDDPSVLACFMIFALPINTAINSYGYFILTDDGNSKKTLDARAARVEKLKRVISVPFLTSITGIVMGLLPVSYPQLFFDVLSPAGGCYSASAMIIAGVSLSSYSLKELFSSKKPYLVGIVRLVVMPLILGGIAFLLHRLLNLDRMIVICTVAFTSLPSGMNVVIFPEFAGKDGSVGAKSCFISYIMALLTIPAWFYLLSVLV